MAPTLHFVRHAQGVHNLSVANHGMHDPMLTQYGKSQCNALQHSFPYAHAIDLIVASPIKRTLYTALLAFAPAIRSKHLKVLALPELQETSDLPCDTGSPRAVLEEEFAGMPVDLSRVEDGWDSKTGRWAPTAEAIEARCLVARKWLQARPEKHIVVVTHGGVLHYLTEDWESVIRTQGTGWSNCEWRSYAFEEGSAEALLKELPESRKRRMGHKKPLSEAEQRNLRLTTGREWEKFGMIKRPMSRGQLQAGDGNRRELKIPLNAAKDSRDFLGGYDD